MQFSTQQEIEPDRWDAKGNRTLGLRSEENPIKSTMQLFDKFITEYAELVEAKGYGKEALLHYKICKNRGLRLGKRG